MAETVTKEENPVIYPLVVPDDPQDIGAWFRAMTNRYAQITWPLLHKYQVSEQCAAINTQMSVIIACAASYGFDGGRIPNPSPGPGGEPPGAPGNDITLQDRLKNKGNEAEFNNVARIICYAYSKLMNAFKYHDDHATSRQEYFQVFSVEMLISGFNETLKTITDHGRGTWNLDKQEPIDKVLEGAIKYAGEVEVARKKYVASIEEEAKQNLRPGPSS